MVPQEPLQQLPPVQVHLAAKLDGVKAADIALRITAASINVEVIIQTAGPAASSAVASVIRSYDESQLSAVLGVTVTAVTPPSEDAVVAGPPPPLAPQPVAPPRVPPTGEADQSSTADRNTFGLTAGLVSTAVIVASCLIAYAANRWLRARKQEQARLQQGAGYTEIQVASSAGSPSRSSRSLARAAPPATARSEAAKPS